MQDDDLGRRPSRAPAGSPECEVLLELFRGGAGSVHLGRLLENGDPTEFVALRRLANPPTPELALAARRAQLLVHPQVVNLLGTFRDEACSYIASDYIHGVTLFELGQAAVRERTPVAADVAVRIVLDALLVTAEADQLLTDALHGSRCLYPESLWIAEAGELFVSEVLVAPILARTTTGAAYVAIGPGMSAEATDVRVAAVELARLACARLMNGNPAGWQTPELPSELSGLLASAIRGGEGTKTIKQFAEALAALNPQLLASRDAVKAELERSMGHELRRRRATIEGLAQDAAPGDDANATRVFRVRARMSIPATAGAVSPAPALPKPPLLKAQGNPEKKRDETTAPSAPPTLTSPAPPRPEEPVTSPISGVWREASARLGVPGRRTRPIRIKSLSKRPRRTSTPAEAALDKTQPQTQELQSQTQTQTQELQSLQGAGSPSAAMRIAIALLLVVGLGLLLRATWLHLQHPAGAPPGAAQPAP